MLIVQTREFKEHAKCWNIALMPYDEYQADKWPTIFRQKAISDTKYSKE